MVAKPYSHSVVFILLAYILYIIEQCRRIYVFERGRMFMVLPLDLEYGGPTYIYQRMHEPPVQNLAVHKKNEWEKG